MADNKIAEDAKMTSKEKDTAETEKIVEQQMRKQRKVRILIPSGRDESERSPVPVGINGYTVLIQRDVEVDVPEGVVNVLKLAKQSVPVKEIDRVSGQTRTVFRSAARFPLQILGYVDAKTGKLAA